MYSTFDIPPDFEGQCTRRKQDGTRLYNTYYQWVSIFLGSQAVIFYIPRCIWLMLEGGLMSYIVKGKKESNLCCILCNRKNSLKDKITFEYLMRTLKLRLIMTKFYYRVCFEKIS